ncbi:MAG: NlpC/P60 family protein [Pseudomonadota bacterium]
MIDPLDKRRNAIRPDCAAAHLKESVERARYAEPTRRAIAVPSARCRIGPDLETFDTEFLFGEPVDVFAVDDGEQRGEDNAAGGTLLPRHWSWVQSAVDGYVGYVETDALRAPGPAPTHKVGVPAAVLYDEPTIKKGNVGRLPLGALVTVPEVIKAAETYARVEVSWRPHRNGPRARQAKDHAFILIQHLKPIDARIADWVAIAHDFVGTPYVWGGKSYEGIDCSGLVQAALQAAGLAAPRDSDMQLEELGTIVPDSAALTRGDLIFWRGHVGIMMDEDHLLHANGHHMLTVVEPLREAVDRLANQGLPILQRKRIDPSGPLLRGTMRA